MKKGKSVPSIIMGVKRRGGGADQKLREVRIVAETKPSKFAALAPGAVPASCRDFCRFRREYLLVAIALKWCADKSAGVKLTLPGIGDDTVLYTIEKVAGSDRGSSHGIDFAWRWVCLQRIHYEAGVYIGEQEAGPVNRWQKP